MLCMLPSGYRTALTRTAKVNLLMVKPVDKPAWVGGGVPKALPPLKSFRKLRAKGEEEPTFLRGMAAGKCTMLPWKVLQPCTKDNSKLKNKSHEGVRGACYVGFWRGRGRRGDMIKMYRMPV